jgi:hypothetical protein
MFRLGRRLSSIQEQQIADLQRLPSVGLRRAPDESDPLDHKVAR